MIEKVQPRVSHTWEVFTLLNGPLCSRQAGGCETGDRGAGGLNDGAGISSSGLSYHRPPWALHMVHMTRWAHTACSFLCIPSKNQPCRVPGRSRRSRVPNNWVEKDASQKWFYLMMAFFLFLLLLLLLFFVVVVWFWCKLLWIVMSLSPQRNWLKGSERSCLWRSHWKSDPLGKTNLK